MFRGTRRSRSSNRSDRLPEVSHEVGFIDLMLEKLRAHLVTSGVSDSPVDILQEVCRWSYEKTEVFSESEGVPNPIPVALPPKVPMMLTHTKQTIWQPQDSNPLAFMTLTHHAIRVGLTTALDLLRLPAKQKEGTILLEQTSRLIDLHTRQEDEVFFPFMRKAAPAIECHNHSHEHEQDAKQYRRTLVQRLKHGVDDGIINEVSKLVTDYEEHMDFEERNLAPVMGDYSGDVLMQAAGLLIKYDVPELLSHAVPFTAYQLCRTFDYEMGIKRYAGIIKKVASCESYNNLSKAMLSSAFEAKPQFAAQLVNDGVLEQPEVSPSLPSQPIIQPPTSRTAKGVAEWIENDSPGSDWNWKNVTGITRNPVETDALSRAERLHTKLAERFAEPLVLKHVTISESTAETSIYFFIDNTWEMARRALFAKIYTRMHKERGKKLHVVIIDAKERRSLAKHEGALKSKYDLPPSSCPLSC